MVLILSSRCDINTNGVIDWLRYFNTPFIRVNDEDIVSGNIKFFFNLNEYYFQIEGSKKVSLDNIDVVWFRKFGFLTSYDDFLKKFDATSNLLSYTYSEFDKLRKLMLKLLSKKKWLYDKDKMPTKIEVLHVAHKNGLKVPSTIVTNNKSYLTNFFSPNQEIIIKSLGEAKDITLLNFTTSLLTHKLNLHDLKLCKFSPTLFQEYIEKKIELRIFYINGEFYSMAMFTQKNTKTSTDFRNYDFKNPPRRVPYFLPKNIENKLHNLMLELGVNTGSIDMIYSKRKEYIFLEVNPSGQFGMTEMPCNFPISFKIAKFLTKSLKQKLHEAN
jgi:ATP-GRASP peptide maturase of grasp-with-spasm system